MLSASCPFPSEGLVIVSKSGISLTGVFVGLGSQAGTAI